MPAFSISVPHTLGKQAARAKLESFVARLREKYGDQGGEANGEWVDDELRFAVASMGIKVKGAIKVEEQQVTVNGDLPFTAMMLKGKIVDSIQQSLQRALAYEKPAAS